MAFYSVDEMFRSFNFFLRMFEIRKYKVIIEPWMEDKQSFTKKYKEDFMVYINQRSSKKKCAFMLSFKGIDNTGEDFVVVFVKKMIKPTAELLLKVFSNQKFKNVIFFSDDAIKSSLTFLLTKSFMQNYEIFSSTDIIFEPILHRAQFEITQVNYNEIEAFLGDKDLTKYKLSKINKTDPLLKYFGFKSGYIKYQNVSEDGFFYEFKQIIS